MAIPYTQPRHLQNHGISGGAKRAGGMVERAVVEAIDAHAAPSVRAAVIELALQWAGRAEVPERGPEVAAFFFGPLHRAVHEELGHEAALAVRAELEPIAVMVADAEVSSVRPSWPELTIFEGNELETDPAPARPTFPTDPAPRRELPLVVVASSDPSSVARLGGALAGVAYLEPARDALALLEGLGRQKTGVIVLDCRHPSVRAETLLAMQPELPEGTRVLLWGETPALERELASLGAGIPRAWLHCGAGASAEDVAAVCRVLFV